MKILQLISSLGFFGAENVLLELARELINTNFQPVVGCFKDQNNPHIEVVEKAKEHNLPYVIFDCNGRFDIKTFSAIRSFIKDNKIDIIHSHNYKSNFYSRISTLGMNVQLISTCHNWTSTANKMKLYAGIDKTLLKKFDKVIAVSDPVMEEVLRCGVLPDQAATIKNGIDVDRFSASFDRSKIRNELAIPEGAIVIGTVGRLTEEKGHNILLGAAFEIIKKHPDVVFLFVGDGPLMHALKKEAGTLPIIFTGVRDDMPEVYSAMDIFVLPSLNEGLPMVLLEAMASKKPVIATNVGNISNVVDHKKNGLLIKPGDQNNLVKAILYMLENEEKSMCMANNGYEKVINHFSSAMMTKEYVKLYKEVLQ